MTEKELVRKLLAGDRISLKEFYFKYKQKLLFFIAKKVANSEDAEEILQDVFIEALDALRDFNFKSSIYTYLCSIASHKVIDYYRKKKIKNVLFSQLPEDIKPLISQIMSPEDEYSLAEMRGQIEAVLANLKPSYSELIKLKYVEGFSIIEIAKKLFLSTKSVESSLFRARMAFIKKYQLLYAKA